MRATAIIQILALSTAANASRFFSAQCKCSDFSLAWSWGTTFNRNGQEVGVSANSICNARGDPRACGVSDIFEVCGESGVCGVGKICYNREVFTSDTFTINGVKRKKNDFANHRESLQGSQFCDALCLNYGKTADKSDSIGSYQWVITGYPQPQAC